MRLIAELAAVVLAVALALVPTSADVVERVFSGGLYPLVQRVVTPVTNLLPFALLDLLIVGALVYVARTLLRGVRDARRARRAWLLLPSFMHVAALVAIAYLGFLAVWGLNYRRVPMAERLVVANDAPSADAVAQLGRLAVNQLNALYASAHTEGWEDNAWLDPGLREAFVVVQGQLTDATPAEPGRPKRSLLGSYFRGAGVDGMINPFGLEVLVNPDLLPFERPFVAAHEWAHLAGYADEAEASFVGWLTCLGAGPPEQYSGWLFVYWQVAAAVGSGDRQELVALMGPGPRGDLEAVADRLRRGQWPTLRRVGWAVYDQYLKANRVEEGVHRYGAVLTLILQTSFEENWAPVRRNGVGQQ